MKYLFILAIKYAWKIDAKILTSIILFSLFFSSIRDQSVLVIEDLSEKGFRSKDWFKYKLNHQEVLLSLTELAKFHACGLAYRLIIFRGSLFHHFVLIGQEFIFIHYCIKNLTVYLHNLNFGSFPSFLNRNGILLPKLLRPTVRKKMF